MVLWVENANSMERFPGSICDVEGISVGQTQNLEARTGVSVVLTEADGAMVGVDVRGAAPGTRETDLCKPGNLVQKAHAVVLAGGSAFGLAATDGVMQYLEQQQIGLDTGVCKVPIVPAAVLYDLKVGNANIRPDAQMGMEACMQASAHVQEGLFGAACGATVSKLVPNTQCANGGIGTASMRLPCGVTVGAIVAVNAVGDIYHPHTGEPLSFAIANDGKPVLAMDMLNAIQEPQTFNTLIGENTSIAVIACDANLNKEQCNRLATIAHDGFARAIRPVHTQFDGDTCFALATSKKIENVDFMQILMAGAEVIARAIYNAVLAGKQQ